MKKLIFCIIFCLAAGSFVFAQSEFPELDKVKKIKLLESTREDVKKIFSEYAEDFEDDEQEDVEQDIIYTGNMRIFFTYSLGNCSDDDDEEWNIPKGKVTEISIIIKDSDKAKDLKIDLSKLQQIKEDEDDAEDEEEDPDDFVYYDKENGISYGLSDGEIENIKFTPLEKNFPALCSNETVREYTSNKDWLLNKLRKRPYTEIREYSVNVAELTLSKSAVTADCPADDSSKSDSDYLRIEIVTKGESGDPTDVLTYNYTVSGGKIIGNGSNVTWDLNGVKPGKYTITAGVDNGCGVCGTTKTVEVMVKEFPDCKQK